MGPNRRGSGKRPSSCFGSVGFRADSGRHGANGSRWSPVSLPLVGLAAPRSLKRWRSRRSRLAARVSSLPAVGPPARLHRDGSLHSPSRYARGGIRTESRRSGLLAPLRCRAATRRLRIPLRIPAHEILATRRCRDASLVCVLGDARGGIRTHGPLQERILSPPPLSGLGHPRGRHRRTALPLKGVSIGPATTKAGLVARSTAVGGRPHPVRRDRPAKRPERHPTACHRPPSRARPPRRCGGRIRGCRRGPSSRGRPERVCSRSASSRKNTSAWRYRSTGPSTSGSTRPSLPAAMHSSASKVLSCGAPDTGDGSSSPISLGSTVSSATPMARGSTGLTHRLFRRRGTGRLPSAVAEFRRRRAVSGPQFNTDCAAGCA